MSVKVVLYKILNKNVKVKFPTLLSMLCDLVYLSYVNLEPIIPSALNFKKLLQILKDHLDHILNPHLERQILATAFFKPSLTADPFPLFFHLCERVE